MERITSPEFEPERSVVLGEPVSSLAPAPGGGGRVTWISRGNSMYRLKVDNPQNGVLVLSRMYYARWRARVFPANYALTGIAVEAGDHDIELSFAPSSFKPGLFVSLFTVVPIAGLFFRFVRP